MNKITFKLYIVLIALLALPHTSKAQTEYKLDSIQQFRDDGILEPLQLTQRIHYTYNNGGIKPTEYLYLKKESGDWFNDYKFNITYNSDNNYLTETYQDWDEINMLWTNLSRGEYEYDEFQNNTILTYYSYDGANWNLILRITSEFNVNNQVTIQLYENVDPMTMTTYKNQSLYTYDENDNNILIENQIFNSTSGLWENSQKIEMTYNGNLIMQQDSFTWTGSDWPLTPNYSQIYDYTSPDIYNVIYQNDSGAGLVNNAITYYTYNNGKPLEIETKLWINDAWKENSKYTIIYDGNDNPSESNQYSWDDGTGAYVLNSKTLYFISEAQPFALGTASQELLLAKMYPNPFRDELNISFKSALKSEGVIQLFDMQGKEISKIELQQGEKSIKINNSYLSNGMYLIHLTNGTEKSIFKVVKQ
jgi:hypothetical protein